MSNLLWEKVLWKTQPHPDNHVPPSFLSSLSMNPNFKSHSYWPLVLGSCAVTQHLSTVSIFAAVFVRLMNLTFDPRLLILICTMMFVSGCVLWEVVDSQETSSAHDRRAKTVKTSILVFLALMALSPILRTLMATAQSDTIWASSAWLFALNAILADYSYVKFPGQSRERISSVISMNAAICAAIMLASRLHDDLSVFALILFSIQLFALFPMLRHRLQASPVIIQTALTLALACFSVVLTAPLSVAVTYIFLTASVAVNFAAPAVLIWAQRYKNEISGPWDAATPKISL